MKAHKGQATLWGEPEEDAHAGPAHGPPSPAELLERVLAQTWAGRVKHYESFGVKPPPMCPTFGRHPSSVVPYRRLRARHVLDVAWRLSSGARDAMFGRVTPGLPVVQPPCRACQAKRVADAMVVEITRARSPMVEAGYTWLRGRMERWADVQDEVLRRGAKEVQDGDRFG